MLEKQLENFLIPYKNTPLILGFSGGCDSMALFLALIKVGHPFIAVHIDHGWREESAKEARWLEKLCLEKGIPFYLKTCQKSDFVGNLELAARNIRLNFFKEILKKELAAGVLLAHHADDLAETTLKKFFEGVSFSRLSSMEPVCQFEDFVLLRPFLALKKRDIVSYLKMNPYISDATNFSADFMRGKMRTQLLPYLNEAFGKNIESALIERARESQELDDYLKGEIEKYPVVSGPFGEWIDLSSTPPLYLLKSLLHKVLSILGLPCHREVIKSLADALHDKTANFIKVVDERRVIADRGHLFILNPNIPESLEWVIEIPKDEEKVGDWRSLWSGRCVGILSGKDLKLNVSDNRFDKWWTQHKVPAFMRKLTPLIMDEKGNAYEFLSGKPKNIPLNPIKVAIRIAPLN